MTNSNLIPVFNGTIANQAIQLCNARELHSFLEVKTQFGNWITDRISDYGFIQDEDYIIVTQRTNGRPRKEYHITLDMGKELGMVERNEKGRQIRKFFIECERKLKEIQKNQQLALPEPEKTYDTNTTAKEIHDLVWLLYSHNEMNFLLGRMCEPLRVIGSHYYADIKTHYVEYKRHYDKCLPILKRFVEQIKADNPKAWEGLQYRLTAK